MLVSSIRNALGIMRNDAGMDRYMTDGNNRKLFWIDSAKGIGVILVVLGHFLYQSNLPMLNRAIYSFHMPLFFILSGYLQKRAIPHGYVLNKVKRLLVPFTCFSVVGIPIFGYGIIANGGNLIDVLVDALYIRGRITNNPLWFLIVLFEVFVINFIFRLSEKQIWYQAIFSGCCFIIGYYIFNYKSIINDLYFGGAEQLSVLRFFRWE